MRKLSESQAKRCEDAALPRCRCRCGGVAHGAKRAGGETTKEFLQGLPEDDPHAIRKQKVEQVKLPIGASWAIPGHKTVNPQALHLTPRDSTGSKVG